MLCGCDILFPMTSVHARNFCMVILFVDHMIWLAIVICRGGCIGTKDVLCDYLLDKYY